MSRDGGEVVCCTRQLATQALVQMPFLVSGAHDLDTSDAAASSKVAWCKVCLATRLIAHMLVVAPCPLQGALA